MTTAAAGARRPTLPLVLMLVAALFINYVDRGMIGIAAPLIKAEMALTATQFGLAVSAFFWVYGPAQLLVGWAVDRFNAEKLLDATHIGMFVAHHRHVVETVHVADGLVERLGLGEFFGATVQEADVRIGTLDDFAVHFENQTEYAVCRGVLRPEVQGVIADFLGAHDFTWACSDCACCQRESSRMVFGTPTRGSMETG